MVSVYPPVGHHLVDSNNGTMVTSPLLTNVRTPPSTTNQKEPFQLGLLCSGQRHVMYRESAYRSKGQYERGRRPTGS